MRSASIAVGELAGHTGEALTGQHTRRPTQGGAHHDARTDYRAKRQARQRNSRGSASPKKITPPPPAHFMLDMPDRRP